MTKTKKTTMIVIIIAIAVEIAIIVAGIFYYMQTTNYSKKSHIGESFMSGNAVMDNLKFSEGNTPVAQKMALTSFNADKSNITIVGSCINVEGVKPYKEYTDDTYSISVCPSYVNGTYRFNYVVAKTNDDDSTTDISKLFQMVFICNGKEVHPSSIENSPLDPDSGFINFGEVLTFENVNENDEFVILVYNTENHSAVAFPFTVS